MPPGHDGSDGQDVAGSDTLRSWIVLGVPALIVLVASWIYRWVQDDAYINFRIIGNLLAGHGPVFNIGERVEAYSDPLWLFLLALAHAVLPWASLEWTSAILGIVCAVAGVLFGGRAIQRLAGSRGAGTVVPIGLFVFSVVAGVWEYVTGGLEMGMVFFWIGLSFWLLVRVEHMRTEALRAAVVMGLGPLIRPELVLESAVFLGTLVVVIAAPNWKGPTRPTRRYAIPLASAAALPVIYELWRMAYFAMFVSNTALAKSAGSAWWGQGFTYLWNFVAPYTLWLPFLLIVPLMAPRILRWWRAGDRIGVLVLASPIVAGLVDTVYVVHVGGDYQHARLLLPAFFAICVALYVEVRQLRTIAVVPVVGIAVWSLACIGWLRFDPEHGYFRTIHWISNNRDTWFTVLDGKSPMDLSSFSTPTAPAVYYRSVDHTASVQGRQEMIIGTNPFFPLSGQVVAAASTNLPTHVVVFMIEIGEQGLISGPDVYVFDAQSLANPIGSHTVVARGVRPGGKVVDPVWMIARFGTPGEPIPASLASPASIAAARTALGCGDLAAYLHAITSPLTPSRAWSDVIHAFTYTTLHFSGNPVVAKNQLCR